MGKDPFKTKNVVTAEKGSTGTTTYAITGSTLEEVYEQIQSKGPTVDGKRYAGATQCTLTGFDEGYEVTSEGEEGEFTGYARFNKSKLKFKCLITLPKFTDFRQKLSDEDQRTWESYLSGVAAHEQEHVDDYEKEITRWAGEVAELRGEATGKDAKRAEAAAKAALGKAFKAAFTESGNTQRLKESARKLDAGTGHGPVLKYKSSK